MAYQTIEKSGVKKRGTKNFNDDLDTLEDNDLTKSGSHQFGLSADKRQ